MAVSKMTFDQRIEQLAQHHQATRDMGPTRLGRLKSWAGNAARISGTIFVVCFAIKVAAVVFVGSKTYDKRAEAGITEMGDYGGYAAPLLRQDPVTRKISDTIEAARARL